MVIMVKRATRFKPDGMVLSGSMLTTLPVMLKSKKAPSTVTPINTIKKIVLTDNIMNSFIAILSLIPHIFHFSTGTFFLRYMWVKKTSNKVKNTKTKGFIPRAKTSNDSD